MKHPSRPRIALFFNANKSHDRELIAGVAEYARTQQLDWDLCVEDPLCAADGARQWQVDGIIGDFEQPQVAAMLARRDGTRPAVAVGGSCADAADYPAGLPYVGTDHQHIIRLAHEHLIDTGVGAFAMYSLPEGPGRRWVLERERAFARRMRRDHVEPVIFRGHDTAVDATERLAAWLRSLPHPVGVIAVNDARARELVRACSFAGLSVSQDVAIIGIDNDPLERALAQVPLSSVIQGAAEMGQVAARLLHRALQGHHVGAERVLVPPVGINAQASCARSAAHHPHVTRGLHFIRQQARRGIKSEQVADYVGVCRSGLDATFRRELGRSVHEEILGYKLEQAKRYLASGTWKIADIAQQCGFSSVQYLYTVFARELGCTPREYQKRQALRSMAMQSGRPRLVVAGHGMAA